MPRTAAIVLFGICILIAFLFFTRLISAIVSPRVLDAALRRPRLHAVWGMFSLLTALLVLGQLNPFFLISDRHELRNLRAEMAQRAQNAGGWDAVRRDCIALVSTNEVLHWNRWREDQTNLPPALAALNPQMLDYDGPAPMPDVKPAVLRIKVFGMHASGGHSTPYVGLEVLLQSTNASYTPPFVRAASGNSHYKFTRVSDGVFEVF